MKNKINILDIDFDIVHEKLSDDTTAKANTTDGKIIINTTVPQNLQSHIMLHEALHIIDWILDLGLTEQQVSGIAAGLNKFVKMP